MVTHDMTEALLLADHLAVMQAGQIIRTGTPQRLLQNPDHPHVEALLGTPQRQAEHLRALTDPENGS
jgi:osmoprotectant transport system ATP-binding protein